MMVVPGAAVDGTFGRSRVNPLCPGEESYGERIAEMRCFDLRLVTDLVWNGVMLKTTGTASDSKQRRTRVR